MSPFPPLIVPLLDSVAIVAPWAFDTPAPPERPLPPAPPLIVPLLVSVVIVPTLDTPAPPAPLAESNAAGAAADRPLLVSVVIAPELNTPAAPAAVPLEGGPRRR